MCLPISLVSSLLPEFAQSIESSHPTIFNYHHLIFWYRRVLGFHWEDPWSSDSYPSYLPAGPPALDLVGKIPVPHSQTPENSMDRKGLTELGLFTFTFIPRRQETEAEREQCFPKTSQLKIADHVWPWFKQTCIDVCALLKIPYRATREGRSAGLRWSSTCSALKQWIPSLAERQTHYISNAPHIFTCPSQGFRERWLT